MKKTVPIKTVNDYNRFIGAPEGHSLVSVIRYEDVSPIPHGLCRFSVYGLFLRDDHEENLDYGISSYDYHEGSLICVQPGQTGGADADGGTFEARGWALLFSPELLAGTPLEKRMDSFTFFAYSENEALHLAPEERSRYIALLELLRSEAAASTDDALSRHILVAYVDLILSLCARFYNRQFATRRAMSGDVLSGFERVLTDYYRQGKQAQMGLPTVGYCASSMSVSPNYLSDLMKRATGHSPISHIHDFLVRMAKNRLVAGERPSNVAYALGFDYPQHFTRLFKKLVGVTPREYAAQSAATRGNG